MKLNRFLFFVTESIYNFFRQIKILLFKFKLCLKFYIDTNKVDAESIKIFKMFAKIAVIF